MKRITFLVTLLIMPFLANSQELVEGSLAPIKQTNLLYLSIDYTEAIICGMPETDYAFYDENWKNSKQEIYDSFKYMLDRECENHHFYTKSDALYRLTFHILKMESQKLKTYVEGYVTLEKEDQIIARIEGFTDKCSFHSFKNEGFCRSMKDMGDHVAEFLNDNE